MIDNFAARAAEWDSPEKVAMTRIFVRELLQNVKLLKSWKGLEIGAGTGLVGLQLLDEINALVFEDTSQSMLEVLKAKLKGDELVEIVHGEIFEYQKQDLDLVFSCMAFHHIPDIDKALLHLSKIMKPNAVIIIGDIRTEDGSFHRFEPIPHCGFDTAKLSIQFEQAGFDVVSSHTYNVLSRERVKRIMTDYEQFMIVAKKR